MGFNRLRLNGEDVSSLYGIILFVVRILKTSSRNWNQCQKIKDILIFWHHLSKFSLELDRMKRDLDYEVTIDNGKIFPAINDSSLREVNEMSHAY